MMPRIDYFEGDATVPQQMKDPLLGPVPARGAACILHVTNNVGVWGAGFVLALEARFPGLRKEWLGLGQVLGSINVVKAHGDPPIYVAHLCAQNGLRSYGNSVPLQYKSLDLCLKKFVAKNPPEAFPGGLHMPHLGCGLAGGAWGRIEPLLWENLASKGYGVHVYDMPGTRDGTKGVFTVTKPTPGSKP